MAPGRTGGRVEAPAANVMSLVPDITVDVGDSTRQEARRRRLCEPVAVGRSAGEGVLSVDGHLSECPAIWESTDPRSTLRRQAGGPVEILVRTAALATFRNDGFSATTPISAGTRHFSATAMFRPHGPVPKDLPHQGMACHGRNRSRRKSWMARNGRAPPSWQFRAPPQLPRRQEIRPARSSNLTCPICRCAGGRWSPPGR